MPNFDHPLAKSIVRIRRINDQEIVGAGFLITKQIVCTCAHVVADALGINRKTQQKPDQPVQIDFPFLDKKNIFLANIEDWKPILPNEEGDIALLRIVDTEDLLAEPARLLESSNLANRTFKVYGFPIGHDWGIWANGIMNDRIANGWVQIQNIRAQGFRVQTGFSGSAVWDEAGKGVVGMIVASTKDTVSTVGFLIPNEHISDLYPELEGLLQLPAQFIELNDQALEHKLVTLIRDDVKPLLSSQDAHRLAEALINCPSLKGETVRQRLFTEADVHPDGFEAMIDLLRYYERDSPSMVILDDILQDLLPQLITRQQLIELHSVLSDITFSINDLQKLYLQNAPLGATWSFPEGRDETEIMLRIVRQLAKAPIQQPRNTHPLIEFIQSVAHACNEDKQHTQQKMMCWADEITQQLGLAKYKEINQVSTQQRDQSIVQAQSYLLVKIIPNDKTTFYVESFLIPDDRVADPFLRFNPLTFEPGPHDLLKLPNVLQDILIDSKKHLSSMMNLTIEFFLPVDLLFHEIDQWRMKPRKLAPLIPLGIEYRVVIRSLERIDPDNRGELKEIWEKRWDIYREYRDAPACNHIDWLNTVQESKPESLYARLRKAQCAGLVRAFPQLTDLELDKEIFFTMISLGIPIILFPRHVDDQPEKVRKAFEKLLAERNLSKLCEGVHEYRQIALDTQDEQHLGHCLIILWDNPYRLPPETPLQHLL